MSKLVRDFEREKRNKFGRCGWTVRDILENPTVFLHKAQYNLSLSRTDSYAKDPINRYRWQYVINLCRQLLEGREV